MVGIIRTGGDNNHLLNFALRNQRIHDGRHIEAVFVVVGCPCPATAIISMQDVNNCSAFEAISRNREANKLLWFVQPDHLIDFLSTMEKQF